MLPLNRIYLTFTISLLFDKIPFIMLSRYHTIKHYISELAPRIKFKAILFLEDFLDIFAWENPKNIKVYIPEGHHYSQFVKQCFNTWEEITQHNISFNYTNDKEAANIEVGFKSLPNEGMFGGTTQKIRRGCWYAVTRKMVITIFLRNCCSGELFSSEVLANICLHEIGHAIGLWRHSFNKNSIMYAKTFNGIEQKILKEDIDRLKKLYKF